MRRAEGASAGAWLQDWTKQEHEDAEGVVTFSYRTEPESPPDVQTIQKQMAIVAWQPGPNRVVAVPTQVGSWAGDMQCWQGGLAVAVWPAGQGGGPRWQLWPDMVVAVPAKLTVLHEREVFREDFMVASVAWQLGPYRFWGLAQAAGLVVKKHDRQK